MLAMLRSASLMRSLVNSCCCTEEVRGVVYCSFRGRERSHGAALEVVEGM